MPDHHTTVESVFRGEYGRIIAGLIRVSHSFDLAEEALQDAFTVAVIRWESDGVPENPAAWITTTARRKLIDGTWAADASYIDPLAEAHGRDAIDATIAAAQAQFPGFVFSLAGPVDTHHQQARFTWGLGPEGAEPPPFWGVEDHVRECFAPTGREVTIERDASPTPTFESLDAYTDFMLRVLGPADLARPALEANGQWDDMRAAVRENFARFNEATDGTFRAAPSYFRISA